MPIPSRVYERFVTGLKKFQPILAAAKTRDAGEADTSTIVKDILSDLFGYDKYTEITSEYVIKATYCDLAVKLDNKLRILVEVKAIGLDLKEAHSKQAIDYAANQGVDWVILTNGSVWRIYRVLFTKPIGQELVYECDLLSFSTRERERVECLFLFAKEGHNKDVSALDEYHTLRQAMSRHYLAAVIMSDPVMDVVRRELRRLSPNVKIDREALLNEIVNEVLKREVTEGEKAEEARRKINKSQAKALRAKSKTNGESVPSEASLSDAAEA